MPQGALAGSRTIFSPTIGLGLVFTEQYNSIGGLALLQEARKYFDAVIAINPDADEAQRSRKYVANIDSVLARTQP